MQGLSDESRLEAALGAAWRSRDLGADLEALCGFGGRFAGTPGEQAARRYVQERLRESAPGGVRALPFDYRGWRRGASRLELLPRAGTPPVALPCTSLVLSPPARSLELEVVDIGRGTAADFAAHGGRLAGRAVLVRHEFAFSVSHVHRRRKYRWALEAGAGAFLIANHLPGVGVVSGSSGSGGERDLPSLGISHEAGMLLAERCRTGTARVRIDIESETLPGAGEHVIAEVPGRGAEVVILCAHIDGHDLAESAMDNASGAVAVLEAARRLAPMAPELRRGLRTILFTVEEWNLTGSRLYVESLAEEERRRIALVINLDTVVGSPRLHALVSGHRQVADFVRGATRDAGTPVTPVFPLQANSDHFNFAMAGIPALRLIAGYEDPGALTRYLLTPADTRDKVDPGQLRVAAMTAATLAFRACTHDGSPADHLPPDKLPLHLDAGDPWQAARS